MIPFVLPFTAPDGSPRRPLAERVPECVPKRDETTRLAAHPQFPANWAWVHSCDDKWCCRYVVEPVPSLEAAALWRCAVEDWLLAVPFTKGRQCYTRIHVMRNGPSFVAKCFCVREDEDPNDVAVNDSVGSGPDLLHALNAAAHAVADALGVER